MTLVFKPASNKYSSLRYDLASEYSLSQIYDCAQSQNIFNGGNTGIKCPISHEQLASSFSYYNPEIINSEFGQTWNVIGDYLTGSTVNSLPVSGTDLTMFVLLKVEVTPAGENHVFGLQQSNKVSRRTIQVNTDGTIGLTRRSTGYTFNSINTTKNIVGQGWTRCVYVEDSSSGRLYINGEEVGFNSTPNSASMTVVLAGWVGFGNAHSNHLMQMCGYAKKAWSIEQIQKWSEDPYMFFQPEKSIYASFSPSIHMRKRSRWI